MKRSELSEFAVEEEGFKLKIRRGGNGLPVISAGRGSNSPFPVVEAVAAPQPTSSSSTSPAASTGHAKEEEGVIYVKSPMVGTFYRAASPESKPFAEAGTKVVENTVVCIIEAMKIMNEIEAEVTGRVSRILARDGQGVEYGQPLLVIEEAEA